MESRNIRGEGNGGDGCGAVAAPPRVAVRTEVVIR
jgi:hypothetical protein